jgi:hypothetical protein
MKTMILSQRVPLKKRWLLICPSDSLTQQLFILCAVSRFDTILRHIDDKIREIRDNDKI